MPRAPNDLAVFTANAEQVAAILRALANERRLMILCKLVEWGEAAVGSLVEAVGLSQSALSQHLAKMREEGIVTYRRESQTLWPHRRSQNGNAARAPAATLLPTGGTAEKRKTKPVKERE